MKRMKGSRGALFVGGSYRVRRLLLVAAIGLGTTQCGEGVTEPPDVNTPAADGTLLVALDASSPGAAAYYLQIFGSGIDSITAGTAGLTYATTSSSGGRALVFVADTDRNLLTLHVADVSADYQVALVEVADSDNDLLTPSDFAFEVRR